MDRATIYEIAKDCFKATHVRQLNASGAVEFVPAPDHLDQICDFSDRIAAIERERVINWFADQGHISKSYAPLCEETLWKQAK